MLRQALGGAAIIAHWYFNTSLVHIILFSPEHLSLGPSRLPLKKPLMHGHTVAFPPESVIFVLAGHCTHVRSRLYIPLGQSKKFNVMTLFKI